VLDPLAWLQQVSLAVKLLLRVVALGGRQTFRPLVLLHRLTSRAHGYSPAPPGPHKLRENLTKSEVENAALARRFAASGRA
jgi:hypothetical protein